jgi:2-dehydro-3-deoxyphosphogluconate aldolase/(4S)-4-hydroxy-2-oxoglutarate aldolase
VAAAVARGIPFVPGIASATELHRALRAGATMVKLFPGSSLGVDYLRHLRGPYPDVPVMVSGGVTIDAIESWFAAGANAVGLGAGAFKPDPNVAAARAIAAATRH